MAYQVQHEPGEKLITQVWYAPPKAEPFSLAISDRAIFLPRMKAFAVKDPRYFERVPISNVRSVAKVRLRPYGWWVFAALLVALGAVTTYWMMEPILRGQGGRVSGFPPGIAVIGCVIPFAVKGRFAIEVRMSLRNFRWKAPIVVDRKSRDQIRDVQRQILDACRQVGIPVEDDGPTPGAPAHS